ncbi:unnamed protein product [Owenia fusiformis]|uniref:Uncharacterized protein n=1 Tax=Owenia fusiformis TaxID=6347 RepID=A0A8J1UWH0_OWEFU|nr:unnamed protein product [Owenia fusiformis]
MQFSMVSAILVAVISGAIYWQYSEGQRHSYKHRAREQRQRDEARARIPNQRHHKKQHKRSDKPNIVIVMTDDQDSELGSMQFMPKTLRLLEKEGAHFENAFVTTPMCCPSRSSFLTGMYVHNHNTYTNNDNCSSISWQQTHETRNFATYLSKAGYRTGYFGKYLNEYNGTYIPPGWSEWVGLVKNTRFYNYTLNFNGRKVKHFDNYYKDYFTDLIANDSVTFLKQSKQYFPNRPVAMVLSMPAPHGPEDAAPQYQHLFENVTTHRTPSWNVAPNPDKQWILQYTGKMEPIHIKFTDMLQRKRLQTLQSVDDAVEKVYEELKNLGELDNTYFIYTSDHGYHLGQYGLLKGKAMPYDFDVRVPFYVRGPGIPKGTKVPSIVLNLDLAPTILDMSGSTVPPHMDGKSWLNLFDINKSNGKKKKKVWRDTFLIERGKITNKQIQEREKLEAEHNNMVGKNERLNLECARAEYKPPCTAKQQWVCKRDNRGRMRMSKCRQADKAFNEAVPKCNCGRKYQSPDKIKNRKDKKKRLFQKQHVKDNHKSRFLKKKAFERRRYRRYRRDEKRIKRSLLDLQDLERTARFMLQDQREQKDRKKRDTSALDDPFSINEEGEESGSEVIDVELNATSTSNKEKNETVAKKCRVLNNDTVVCKKKVLSEIFNNEEYEKWKNQKEKIDSLIQEYKEALDKLKDVRKKIFKEQKVFFWDTESEPVAVEPSTEPPSTTISESTTEITIEENGGVQDSKQEDPECNCEDYDYELERFTGGDKGTAFSDEYSSDYVDTIEMSPFDGRRQQRRSKRQRLKMERQRLREARKRERRKNKKKDPTRDCNAPSMNCFTHNNHHWKTAPLWNSTKSKKHPKCQGFGLECHIMSDRHWKVSPLWDRGPFCFCSNSNNNTYWCLRTINSTNNHLYCEFITGFISYYDMYKDPYQLRNAVHDLSYPVLQQLHEQLNKLRKCKGAKECTVRSKQPGEGTTVRGRRMLKPFHPGGIDLLS